ncbi:MAG: ABC transporter ATP-binding protein [Prevotellaceae bacterium]|nr:ABC transporter ATP-binding protein [Prevotellaceae bacterium]
MAFIELTNIRKGYPDGNKRFNHILKEVNLSIKKEEFVAIKGSSGAGKTTLLSILGTLLRPDAGNYLLDGQNMIDPHADYAAIRNKWIGFVFQDHRLLPQFTALENILLPLLAYQPQADAETIEYARQLMALTHISGVEAQYPHTLSGGEASRVAVCRALVLKPILLLADEPTGQLDAENAKNVAKLLADLNQSLHTTIVMVTHSDEVSSVAHRIMTLKDGMILA